MPDHELKNKPLVSICIPTYKAAAFLRPCLLSAVRQTYQPLEILVCDHGSPDETIEIVRQFQAAHPQIRLVQNTAAKGMVDNWNQCISLANGDWIKFLFQDDVLEPDCVTQLLLACERQQVPLGLCRRDFLIHDDASPHAKAFFAHAAKAENVFAEKPFVSPEDLAAAVKQYWLQNFLGEPSSFLFHRTACGQTAFFRSDLVQLVDYEFVLRLGLQKGFAFVPAPLVHFRVHGGSQSSANTSKQKATQTRNIKADSGDFLLLLTAFLHDSRFARVRAAVGSPVLVMYLKHFYYAACKNKGKKQVHAALNEIWPLLADVGLKYNFFRYVYYRYRVKQWEKTVAAKRLR